MSLREQFATNVQKEVQGVEIKYAPNADGSVPTFIISRMGKSNRAYQKALERETRPHRRAIDLGTVKAEVAEKLFLDVFAETIVKGWKNVQPEADGVNVQYSKEAAIKLFTELPELYEDLQAQAKNASLFRDEAIEDEAKN